MPQPESKAIANKNSHEIALDWYNKGEKAVTESQTERAITCYRKATQFNPKFSWAYHKLADNLSELKRWKPAISAYRQAIELKPDFFWSYHNLGNALSQLERWNQAITAYVEAINIQPDFCWSYYNLGDALAQKQRWHEAVEAYIQAEKLQQDLPGLSQRLGQVLHQQAQPDLELVIQQYCQRIKASNIQKNSIVKYQFSAQDLPIYTRLAQALEQEKYFAGAIILDEIALIIKPENSKIKQHLDRVCLKQYKLEKQIIAAHQAAENNPNSYQAHYELGAILSQQQQWNSAISAYLKAIKLQPEQPSWLYQGLWQVLAKQGRLEEAIQLYREAITQNPHSVWCYVNLGEMLTQQGKIEEAIQCYQAAAYHKTQQFYPDWMNYTEQLIPVKKPNFLIIGTQKGGTTSLYYYLAQHPQIVPSLIKEIDYWSHKYERGLEWYLAHFLPQLKSGNFLTGEATPSYLDSQGVAERISKVFPDIKLIILLRNPVERAISHYYQWVSLKWESRSLKEAIQSEINQSQDSFWDQPNSYLARGVYVEFIKAWMEVFPREQILILNSEDFYTNPAQSLTQIFNFLELPDYSLSEYKPYNARSYPEIDDKLQKTLTNYFQPYNQALEDFLKVKLNWDI
ncbi:MAG: tetratricopeptide repeat protein [Microcoleaceae cyanobacterium]